MKFLVLVIFAVVEFATPRSFATEPPKPSFACRAYYAGGESLIIFVLPAMVSLHRTSPSAKYVPLRFAVVSAPYVETQAKPLYKCTESSLEDYSLTIKVFKEEVQVLQSSPNHRFAPLQYKIIGAQG